MIITKSVTIAYDSNLICRGYTISRIDNPRVFKGYIILPTKKAIIAGKIKDCGTDFMEMDFVQFFSFMGADWGKGKLSFNFKDRKYKEAVLYEGVVKERGNLRINTGFFMKVIDDAKRARILEERTKKNIESISPEFCSKSILKYQTTPYYIRFLFRQLFSFSVLYYLILCGIIIM